MLILTRRIGEQLMIGDDVVVAVLGVKGNQVRLGINAPDDVPVHREEIYERIKAEEGNGEKAKFTKGHNDKIKGVRNYPESPEDSDDSGNR